MDACIICNNDTCEKAPTWSSHVLKTWGARRIIRAIRRGKSPKVWRFDRSNYHSETAYYLLPCVLRSEDMRLNNPFLAKRCLCMERRDSGGLITLLFLLDRVAVAIAQREGAWRGPFTDLSELTCRMRARPRDRMIMEGGDALTCWPWS